VKKGFEMIEVEAMAVLDDIILRIDHQESIKSPAPEVNQSISSQLVSLIREIVDRVEHEASTYAVVQNVMNAMSERIVNAAVWSTIINLSLSPIDSRVAVTFTADEEDHYQKEESLQAGVCEEFPFISRMIEMDPNDDIISVLVDYIISEVEGRQSMYPNSENLLAAVVVPAENSADGPSAQHQKNISVEDQQVAHIIASQEGSTNNGNDTHFLEAAEDYRHNGVTFEVSNNRSISYGHVVEMETEEQEQEDYPATTSSVTQRDMEDIPYSYEYNKLWLERKTFLEKEAERKARTTALQWQKEKKTLKQIIDESLKEYVELYERANALLFQFEYEKAIWMNTLQNSLQNNSYPAISNGKSIFFCTSTHRFFYLVFNVLFCSFR
jgi:hypothetical protein